ncbi:MAG: ComEA family DNA-binding protein [Lachnospiraceae bacterium]|nr:ComEA family DNA-binding protein [Lachnospiraceae bacterium]
MFLYRIYIISMLMFQLLWLSGCSGQAVSLEEALLAEHGGMVSASEQDSPVSDVGAETAGTEFTEAEKLLYVYVCGAVAEPGVYALQEGSRIVAAVEAAGGFLPVAATEAVNLAELIRDGMQIVVPDLTEYEKVQAEETRQQDGRVNLNTASAEALCGLSGIGEAKAEAILAYREEIGGFHSIEQLKEVSGIGDSLFNQIKDKIYIE